MLPTFRDELGLPVHPNDGSKRDRMTASLNALANTELCQSASNSYQATASKSFQLIRPHSPVSCAV